MDKDKLRKLRIFYVALILALVVSAFAVPYLILNSNNTFFGAFFYWSIFALIVIFITIKITSYWRD